MNQMPNIINLISKEGLSQHNVSPSKILNESSLLDYDDTDLLSKMLSKDQLRPSNQMLNSSSILNSHEDIMY